MDRFRDSQEHHEKDERGLVPRVTMFLAAYLCGEDGRASRLRTMTTPPLPRVLVVDDEPMLVSIIARELRGHFEVIPAGGLAQAVAQLDRHQDLVAVVSDFDLGRGTTGLQVLEHVRRRRPAAVRILVSGRAHPEDVAEHVRGGLVGSFLQKPWNVGTLQAALVAALATVTIDAKEASMQTINDTGARARLPAIQDGDEDATSTVFLRWRRLLLWRIHHVHGVPFADAEDVLQETYERFLPYPIRIEHPRRMLIVIAASAAADFHRRRHAEERALEEYARARRPRPSGTERSMLARIDAGRALAAAKGKCYELLTAVMVLGVTHAEYAAAAGTPRGTIGTAVISCLDKVRRHLAREAQRKARVRYARNA